MSLPAQLLDLIYPLFYFQLEAAGKRIDASNPDAMNAGGELQASTMRLITL